MAQTIVTTTRPAYQAYQLLWLAAVEPLPRRTGSDVPITRETGAQLVDRIIGPLHSPSRDARHSPR
jgi:hypothetical protein